MSRRIINTLQGWLEDYCRRTSVLTCGVVAEANARGEVRILAEWPQSPEGSQILVDTAGIALQRREAGIVVPPIAQGEDGTLRIATLLLDEDTMPRVVALGINSSNEAVGQSLLTDLHGLRPTLNRLIRAPDGLDGGQVYVLLALQSALLGESSLDAAALAFVNELNASFRFDRTSLGLIEDGRVRLAALSHNAEFRSRQDLLRALAAAMEEAADQGATLTQPPRPDDKPHIQLAHAEFAVRAGVSLCSLPLVAGDRLIGILTIERSGSSPPSRDEAVHCEHLAALAAPIIELRQQAERPLYKQLLGTLGRRGGQRPNTARWLMLATTVVVAAVLLLPMPYRINAVARIEGLEQRVLVAPIDGFLRQSHVRPGDVVKAGQVLAEMADQDLALETRKWQAELTQHENAYIAAMARTDRAAFSVSRAKANEATAQLELARSQLARMRIVAPIDGVVVQGDLSQSLGAPVRRGETLLTIAPQGRHRLLLAVDERDIAEVRPGVAGRLALSALPDAALPCKVERIVPVAVTRDGANRFEVEASLDGVDGVNGVDGMAGDAVSLRAGMQGVAKLDAGKRSLLWQGGHRLFDWARLHLFAWGM